MIRLLVILVFFFSMMPLSWAGPPLPTDSNTQTQTMVGERVAQDPLAEPSEESDPSVKRRKPALGHVESAALESGGALLLAGGVVLLACLGPDGSNKFYSNDPSGCMVADVFVTLMVVPATVWLIGSALGWDGSFGVTLLGSVLGAVLVSFLTLNVEAPVGVPIGAPIGAAVFFQLSANPGTLSASHFEPAPSVLSMPAVVYVPILNFDF